MQKQDIEKDGKGRSQLKVSLRKADKILMESAAKKAGYKSVSAWARLELVKASIAVLDSESVRKT